MSNWVCYCVEVRGKSLEINKFLDSMNDKLIPTALQPDEEVIRVDNNSWIFTASNQYFLPVNQFISVSLDFPELQFRFFYISKEMDSLCGEFTIINGDITDDKMS